MRISVTLHLESDEIRPLQANVIIEKAWLEEPKHLAVLEDVLQRMRWMINAVKEDLDGKPEGQTDTPAGNGAAEPDEPELTVAVTSDWPAS